MKKGREKMGIQCKTCAVAHLCLGRNIKPEDLSWLDEVIQYVKIYAPGEHLFFSHEMVNYVFAIKSGGCKDYLVDQEGVEYVNDFYLPGDIVGLEYLDKNAYRLNAVAIKPTVACLLPVEVLRKARPFFYHRAFDILSEKLESHMAYQQTTNAKRRTAVFFLDLIRKTAHRALEAKKLVIPMTHADISHRIGIASETLSRILTEFAELGYLVVKHHFIEHYDVNALEELVGYPVLLDEEGFDLPGHIASLRESLLTSSL